ncbi:unnamed protein product [Alopecurus aequalis]
MRPRLEPCRRSLRLAAGDGPDLISTLPDDLLLLILVRLSCAAAAARTGVLSRRWRGLWSGLRRIFFNDVALPSLEWALGRFPPPPPAVSLLQICLRKPRGRVPKEHRPDAARLSSLLSAAARLDPDDLFLVLPSRFVRDPLLLELPCFHRATSIALDLCSTITMRCVPAGIEFPALETLSLSHCAVDLDALLSRCPRLRTLRPGTELLHWHWCQLTPVIFLRPCLRLADVWFPEGVLSVTSLLLQELVVASATWIKQFNIVAPMLRQLTTSLRVYRKCVISFLAPMVENVSWQCYCYSSTMFGLWRLDQLSLEMAEGQGQLSSLQMHAGPCSGMFHGEADNLAEEIEKHMIIAFSVLELHLTTDGHVYGAFVAHLLGIDRIRCDMQMLKVSLERSKMTEECPPHCPCDSPNWKTQTISLTSLEQVEINGFEGEDHEFDLLKLILRCAPMLKGITMKLSQEASESSDNCTKIYDILRAYSSVECYVYLSSGLMHGSQNCLST